MKLNFKNEKYIEIANDIQTKSKQGYYETCTLHEPEDAFMLLINGQKEEDLDNLCRIIQSKCPELTIEDCYSITQGNLDLINNQPKIVKQIIYGCAMECINSGNHLGSHTIADGKTNTSSYISHSLYEAKLARELATIIGVDGKKAETLAILHDFGRKDTHTFEHVTRGFEMLVDLGWEDEAVGTLTHSFLNGGRCANCDPSEEGFYIDEEGHGCWRDDKQKDDVTKFLEGYNYSIYDNILNVADLMATSRGIVSPQDRVSDIRTRKPADEKNEGFFLSEFTNKLNEFLVKIGDKKNFETTKVTDGIEKIRECFEKVSSEFFETFKQIEQEI